MKAKNGFTLIELLVVIAIIGLLSSVILASLSTARMKARDARRIADLKQISLALELYSDSKGYYPGVNGVWDVMSYDFSDGRKWQSGVGYTAGTYWSTDLAVELAPYIAKLPVDPINSTCTGAFPNPWESSCYQYAYGNVGRYVNKPTYDLIAKLETPNHPQNCGNNNYYVGRGAGNNIQLCGASPVAMYVYSPN